MTEEPLTWDALAAKTWGDLEEVPPRDGEQQDDPFMQDVTIKISSLEAEIETLKARVRELESTLFWHPLK